MHTWIVGKDLFGGLNLEGGHQTDVISPNSLNEYCGIQSPIQTPIYYVTKLPNQRLDMLQ